MAAPNAIRLRYFMFPGRVYAARVALFNSFGKDGWVDERIGQGQFKKLKIQAAEDRKANSTSSALLTNNLPQLVLADGTAVGQSHAIARWAARQRAFSNSSGIGQYCLYPRGDDALALRDALVVDETMSLVDAMVGFAPKDEDKELRARNRAAYASPEGFFHIGMNVLESRLQQSSTKGPFFLGKELSICDLYLKKPLTDMILDKQFEGVKPEYLEQFPRVRAHTDAVAAHPLVVEYLENYKN